MAAEQKIPERTFRAVVELIQIPQLSSSQNIPVLGRDRGGRRGPPRVLALWMLQEVMFHTLLQLP